MFCITSKQTFPYLYNMLGMSVTLHLPRLAGCHILCEVRTETEETLSILFFCEVRAEVDETVVHRLFCEVGVETEDTVEHLAYNTTHHQPDEGTPMNEINAWIVLSIKKCGRKRSWSSA